MRWNKRKEKPKYGDKRMVIKFLWFPKTLNDETRWLETTAIIQLFSEVTQKVTGPIDPIGFNIFRDKWVDTQWLGGNRE